MYAKKRLDPDRRELFPEYSMPTMNDIRSALEAIPRGGLTTLARETGFTTSVISAWKKGTRGISYENALRLIPELRRKGLL